MTSERPARTVYRTDSVIPSATDDTTAVWKPRDTYKVVSDARQDTSFKNYEEANGANLDSILNEGCPNRADPKAKRDGRDEPAGPAPLAHDVGGNLKQDVRYVEDGENHVVVITDQANVLFETRQSGISYLTVSSHLILQDGHALMAHRYLLCR